MHPYAERLVKVENWKTKTEKKSIHKTPMNLKKKKKRVTSKGSLGDTDRSKLPPINQ